ncbi:MAG: ABC transporter permease subunit [Micromonosporaceae bacterium]|nr:ABC transporter permease subunit [Micromonosporaceae bacterium]
MPAGSATTAQTAEPPLGEAAPPRPWRARFPGWSVLLLPALTLVLSLAAWWAATTFTDVQRILLPPPADVLAELRDRPDYLAEHGRVTLVETLGGFAIATAGGLVIGTAIALSRVFSQMTYPWLVAFNAIPKIALAPLLIVWLGFNLEPKVAMAVLVCFFPVVLATASGLTSTPAELVELARSLDASRWQTFAKVRFPYALPQIFIGLKLAVPLAVIGAVIGEFAGGREGLGYVVNQSGGLGRTDLAFAALVVLSVISIVLYYVLVGVERLLLPWVRATTS